MNEQLKAKLDSLPRTPGVYFHKSKSGEIIYIGKAAVLKNRVRQYFQNNKDFDVKTRALVAEIADTDWLETESEIDALFLESEMVKRYMPRYNILLRDDKSQTFIRIDMKSDWPTVTFTRNPADDGADYHGPYYSGFAIKKALRLLRKVFPYYTKTPSLPRRADLDVHLGLSPSLKITSPEYKRELKKLAQYIKGGRVKLIREIEKQMKAAARQQDFEEAARHRNRLQSLKSLQQKIMFGDREFLDISKDKALNDLQKLFCLPKAPARIEGYDISHMSGTNAVASMVVFTNGVSDRGEYRKFKMTVERNDDVANMRETILRRFSVKNSKAWSAPDLIVIDGGKSQLAAAIAALNERKASVPIIGIAKREEQIIIHKSGSNIDDKLLREYVTEPPSGVYVESEPQYYIVNLHAGQINASGHSRNLRGSDNANYYSDVTKLFQRIRDESHRFAVSYHTNLKRSGQIKSPLEDVPGVGPATRKKLIKAFGSLRSLQGASEDEIAKVIGVKKAKLVKQKFKTNGD